ncbi:glycosyltransferase [Microbacterium sp.]|uniref:glycosyltransferase n=1 Tax=Microbacterium sp. TaxID=51671 RepID=UPI00373523A4
MNATPLVSIVIPAFNDAERIANALSSCIAQTLGEIEIIVVDDASTDDTARIVQEHVRDDPRISLLRQPTNASALQARRAGVMAARADYVLFLDGDDELAPGAAATALEHARSQNTDLLQFGVDVVRLDGSTGGRFESRLQPRQTWLEGDEVLRGLFPIGEAAQGQLWRYLFRTGLLREVYQRVPEDLALPRVNDLPIMFLAAASAKRFASIPDRLYRYHFGQGSSGHKLRTLEQITFYASGIASIDSIGSTVADLAVDGEGCDAVEAAYRSVREFIVGYTTSYVAQHTPDDLVEQAFSHLRTLAPFPDIVRAVSRHFPSSLDLLAARTGRVDLGSRTVRSVLLTTSALRTGGVSGVLLAQARILSTAGYRVTIVAHEPAAEGVDLPAAEYIELSPGGLADQLAEFVDVCRTRDVDVVIDHTILYSRTWPIYALAARAEGIATIGWAHNFALRPVLLGLKRLAFQARHVPALAIFVVLSRLDVAFWKLQGMPRTVFLPNPPSDIFVAQARRSSPRTAPRGRRAELIWWGRLEERTKRPSELIAVASELAGRGVDFRLRIVGPDWNDLSGSDLETRVARAGLESQVEITGLLTGGDLQAAIDSADVFVNTSVIEGHPLTLPEAQSHGLPVAMYELPWLELLDGNEGVVTTPQRDAAALAAAIVTLVSDPHRYEELSSGSLAAAERVRSQDLTPYYRGLFAGELHHDHSPDPTTADAQQLIDLAIEFAEDFTQAPSNATCSLPTATVTAADQSTSGESGITSLAEVLRPTANRLLERVPALRPLAQTLKHRLFQR